MSGTSALMVPKRQPFILFSHFFLFWMLLCFSLPSFRMIDPVSACLHLPRTPYILTVENDRSVEVLEIVKMS